MQIPIPRVLVRVWDAFCDWGNVPIWQRGRFELRRLDVLLAAGGIFCVGYYYYFYGWRGALQGGVAYVLMAMIALWGPRKNDLAADRDRQRRERQ
jgi:hypothetical protein